MQHCILCVGLLLSCWCCCAQRSVVHAAPHRPFERLRAPAKPNSVFPKLPVARDRLPLAPNVKELDQASRFSKPYNVCTSDWSPMVSRAGVQEGELLQLQNLKFAAHPFPNFENQSSEAATCLRCRCSNPTCRLSHSKADRLVKPCRAQSLRSEDMHAHVLTAPTLPCGMA